MGRIFTNVAMGTMAVWLSASALAQGVPSQQFDDAARAMQRLDMEKIQEQMAAAERAMQHVDLSQIQATPIPLHPGAARYYREKGYMK